MGNRCGFFSTLTGDWFAAAIVILQKVAIRGVRVAIVTLIATV